MRGVDQKIVIVTRRTRLQELIARENTRAQAKFRIARARLLAMEGTAPGGKRPQREKLPEEGDFSDYEREDAVYRAALERLQHQLDFGLKIQLIDRSFLPNFIFAARDIVVTLGQDGLVANTAKYALHQPIVAVNPDPDRFDGILLPFHVDQARSAVRQALEGTASFREVTLAQVVLNDGQRLLAFNDLFIGNRTHISARYRIEAGGRSEPHSSSGVLVSTGAGSTGWLSSVFNMTAGVLQLGGDDSNAVRPLRLPWEDPRLVFVVREPFVSKHSRGTLVAGLITPGEELILESLMPNDGVIFSDGIETDFLQFNSGTIARIHAPPERARLIV
jgi:NAD kinase